MLFDCLRGGVVRNSRAEFRAQFTRCVQGATKVAVAYPRVATTTWPRAAALRALTNKQHNRVSRVVAVLSFDPNMPRAPHVALNLGPEREKFGSPKQIAGCFRCRSTTAQSMSKFTIHRQR
jgi:hypothetical protein